MVGQHGVLMGALVCLADKDASAGLAGFSLRQGTSPVAQMQPLHPLHCCRVCHTVPGRHFGLLRLTEASSPVHSPLPTP